MKIEYSICSLAIMTALISFLGFVLENIWLLCRKGYADNRNMNLPFLLGYGLLVVGMYLLIGTPESIALTSMGELRKTELPRYLLYFAFSFILVSAGEIILGKLVEKTLGFEYWNYSKIPLHITKYTSIPTSTGFALIITFFMGRIFTPVMAQISQLPEEKSKPLAIVLMTGMVIDFAVSFAKMYRTGSLNTKWRIMLTSDHKVYKKSS